MIDSTDNTTACIVSVNLIHSYLKKQKQIHLKHIIIYGKFKSFLSHIFALNLYDKESMFRIKCCFMIIYHKIFVKYFII